MKSAITSLSLVIIFLAVSIVSIQSNNLPLEQDVAGAAGYSASTSDCRTFTINVPTPGGDTSIATQYYLDARDINAKFSIYTSPPFEFKDNSGNLLLKKDVTLIGRLIPATWNISIKRVINRTVLATISNVTCSFPTSFLFTAVGDSGASANAANVFKGIGKVRPNFSVHLGDMGYGEILPESEWAKFVNNNIDTGAGTQLSASLPYMLIAGNHESGGESPGGGLIENYATYLTNRDVPISGTYSKQYYFDYPSYSTSVTGQKLARFIEISPGITFSNGGLFTYTTGTSRYNWVSSTIDQARTAGIPWVIVSTHKNCITMGKKRCEISADLMNLLISKRVDLVLQGHEHDYQRSKQLRLSSSCVAVPINLYQSNCVVDDGSDKLYTKNAGTIFVVAGTGGRNLDLLNTADSEAGYFAATSSQYGFLKVNGTATSLNVSQLSASGSTIDSFSIR